MTPEAESYLATLGERIAAHPVLAERSANYGRRARAPKTRMVKVAARYLERLERAAELLRMVTIAERRQLERRAAALAENSQPGGGR